MNKTISISAFFILSATLGFATSAYALNHNSGLVVSNIGSSGSDNTVPPWIKTTMGYWVEGHTTDSEFLSAVEFLANEEIIRVDEKMNMGEVIPKLETEQTSSGGFDTEMVSMNAVAEKIKNHEERLSEIEEARYNLQLGGQAQAAPDSFFDIFYETYSVDSFFDIFTELQESTDSFFDVFFEVETPRTSECRTGQELKWNDVSSSWTCESADTTDSFFDVFFEVSTDTVENTEDIAELERKVMVLEKKIAELESQQSSSGDIDRSSEYYIP